MFLRPMTVNEVRLEIMSLNNTNSEGFDEINTKIIKACTDVLAHILTHLINLSFSTGVFPEILKLSIVKPILKKGKKDDVANYRPITLISILSKVLEKCMYKRLLDFCNKYQIIKNEQYGFQKHKSTSLAIFSLIKIILTNLNKNNLTSTLFFDLSKAFDFVSHDRLLQKLSAAGIRGNALQWISSYLNNRKQCVTITKLDINKDMLPYSSEYRHNKFGVPQGSVLGPILFILYINDITNVTNHKCILFADDISITVTSDKNNNTIKDHETEINNTIDKITEWLDINNLKINLTKSKYIQFNKSYNTKYNFSLNIAKIKEVTQTKFLGVIIDQDINWKAQVDSATNRINKFIYALRQIKNITNVKTAISSYRAYIESILRYGLIMWGNSTEQNRAFIAQKKCIRAIYGLPPNESCKPLFKELALLPLPSLYIYEICMFVHKHQELFVKASDLYPRNKRNPDRLVLEDTPKSTKYNKNCLTMCVRIYNKIPSNLKVLSSKLFKNKLYEWLNVNNFYNIKELLDKN